MNSPFGKDNSKTFVNIRNFKLMTVIKRRYEKLVMQPNFKTAYRFSENLIGG